MSKEVKTGSNLGFFIFLGIAAVFIIPIALGVRSFDKILVIGKILLITIGITAVVLFSVLLYLRIKRKRSVKRTGKTEEETKKGEKNEEEKEEEKIMVKRTVKTSKEELDDCEVEFFEESLERQEIEQEVLELEKLNQKYDL
ncbi:MAG: hypothetical protein ACTSSH_14060 [Candidatus Heimdallarchaeota archaeon]